MSEHSSSSSSSESLDGCAGLNTFSPDDTTHQDCPVIGKTRYVALTKGQTATIRWQLRNRAGNTISLEGCVSAPGADDSTVLVRITEALGGSCIRQVVGTVSDYGTGIISFVPPDSVTGVSGIYLVEMGVLNSAGELVFSEKGYISIENGLFGSTANVFGPPTINEIRIQLRDTMIENDLLSDVEFDDVEIVHSILRPVREWNETPPNIGTLTASHFPYHFHWVNAIISNLLFIAAHWYERNSLPSQHGGVTVNDRAKANPYLAVASQMRSEWREFILRKKIELNIELGMGDFGSAYD